jgi:general secretion pathway protein I
MESLIQRFMLAQCKYRKTSCEGFTLLEVMVAVAIIAISFVSLLSSQSQSISYAAISRFETVASLLTKQKLAEIQLAGFDELNAEQGDFEGDFADFHWQTEVEDLSEDDTGIPGAEDLLKIVALTVSRGDDEDMVLQVRAVVMKKIEAKQ